MFAKTIIDSDAFLDMPLSTQSLYFHLSMRADDDGFINNPKKIQRMIGASEDDLKLLVAKRFILAFENGVIVIKHWRMHNAIRKDRYTPTQYQEQMSMLMIKDNKSYTEINHDNHLATTRQPLGNQVQPQVRLGKDRIGKGSVEYIVDDSEESQPPAHEKKKKIQKHRYGEYDNVLLTDEEMEKLKNEFPDIDERIENLSSYVASTGKKYKSHYATIRNWARKDKEQTKQKSRNQFNNFPQRERTATEMSELEKTMLHRSIPTKTVNDDP